MNNPTSPACSGSTRRTFLRQTSAAVVIAAAAPATLAQAPKAAATNSMTIIDFERQLKKMRMKTYRRPAIDILKEGFRPVGGSVADFGHIKHNGREHIFYIERRLQDSTPFYPGHEIYFGHASTANFFDWEVHDPVLVVRENSWEEAHVWAPAILREGDEFIMAYTGLNRHLSQDLGIASSKDLFAWKRWDSNPISPCKGATWAAWWDDEISSCRDPDLFRRNGRVWMPYTANTKEGATCIALSSTADFKKWKHHGPIIVGPATGYEPKAAGGHTQGSFESPNLSYRKSRWTLIFKAAIRARGRATWMAVSDNVESFSMEKMWSFWAGATCVEIIRDQGDRSLVAGVVGGYLRFAETDWSQPQPSAQPITDRATLEKWQSV